METLSIERDPITLTKKQSLVAKSLGYVGFAGGTALAISNALSLTAIIAGKTAAVGAISSTTVMTSAGPVVFSVVKASLFSKIICVTAGVLVAAVAGYSIYVVAGICFEKWNDRDKSAMTTAISTLKTNS